MGLIGSTTEISTIEENIQMELCTDTYGIIDYNTLLLDGLETGNVRLVKYVTDNYKPDPEIIHEILSSEDVNYNNETYNHLKEYIMMSS